MWTFEREPVKLDEPVWPQIPAEDEFWRKAEDVAKAQAPMKYDDLKWSVFNNGGIGDDGRIQGEIRTGAVVFGGCPLELCKDIVNLHNASLGTLHARHVVQLNRRSPQAFRRRKATS